MNTNDLKLIEQLSKKFNIENTDKSAETLEQTLEMFIANNPSNSSLYIKLALLLFNPPLYDYLKASQVLENLLNIDPNNVYGMLLLLYIVDHSTVIELHLFEKLCSISTDNLEHLSMLEYAKSWYYQGKDEEKYLLSLQKSIEYCDTFVLNFINLGILYLRKKEIEKGHKYLKKALSNITHVYKDTDEINLLDIEEFLNESVKGIHRSQENYEILLESFDFQSPWVTGDFININKDKIYEGES